MATKKIFVLGNGFDLAHYLPTMYVHFMEAMKVIESSDDNKELGFEELFAKYNTEECSVNDKMFFNRVKEIYKIEDLKLTNAEVVSLKEKLKNNGWFQHFKHHLSNIDTWIDFETEIENTLLDMNALFRVDFDNSTVSSQNIDFEIENKSVTSVLDNYRAKSLLADKLIQFSPKYISKMRFKSSKIQRVLSDFSIVSEKFGYFEVSHGFLGSGPQRYIYNVEVFDNCNIRQEDKKDKGNFGKEYVDVKLKNIIDKKYLNRFSRYYTGFKEEEVFKGLLVDLEMFAEIFYTYINLIVNRMKEKMKDDSIEELNGGVNAVFTFNYSNTFERLYGEKIVNNSKVQYIHGSAVKKNIVLGISDLDDNLKKYKIYGFVKTFQKILKDTDFMFLEHNSLDIVRPKSVMEPKSKYELIIWGHSLDSSDAEYIREIFNLNQPQMAAEVVVKVWYHSSAHKQLANLMHIMGKDIIQKWTKQGWLIFEKAPALYKSNAT